MIQRRIEYTSFSLLCPADWQDVTDALGDDTNPITLANPDHGVGALQFSVAHYRSGPIPNPTAKDLVEMVMEFGATKGLGESLSLRAFESRGLLGAEAHYRSAEDFVAVWYLSNGQSILVATYVCDWSCRDMEFAVVIGMVETIELFGDAEMKEDLKN